MTVVRLHTEARADLEDAARWYEQQRRGLGEEFLDAVKATLMAITENPQRFAELETNTTSRDLRRGMLERFPYIVVFEVRGDLCVVVAVAHAKRRPNYWKNRLKRTPEANNPGTTDSAP